jgi:ATP-dependent Clp protease adaptor protein ClpS
MIVNPKHKEEIEIVDKLTDNYHLVLYNDDVNTFDWVIQTLIEICEHTLIQAEQCAWIVHYKGKCSVKEGEFSILKNMKDVINKRGIDAKIESII